MEESRELQKTFAFLQGLVYGSIVMEVLLFAPPIQLPVTVSIFLEPLGNLIIYQHLLLSKGLTIFLVLIVAIGTRSRKVISLNPLTNIVAPILVGLLTIALSIILFESSLPKWVYVASSFLGVIVLHIGLDNVSKLLKSGLMKDRFNIENESFDQCRKRSTNSYSVNIPIKFHFKGSKKGWINITNPFRGTLLIGTPGSGKTFSVILPFVKQHLAKNFSMLLYDYKYPDLAKVAYHHRRKVDFHVINLDKLEVSRRINPLKPEYISTLADATETAEALVEALRKSDKAQGADQFFHQSAINLLSAIIYFFSRHNHGQYSTLPHVLAFSSLSYPQVFSTLFSMPELESLLSPFKSAYEVKAFDQLEGQVGTLKINLSRLATKEIFWVFSESDFDMGINGGDKPAVLVLAGNPDTQNINSAAYSVVLNRLTRLINRKNKLPCSVILDEMPTLYVHKIENLIATARSNKVSVLLGLQELPQLRQQYGRQAADTICSVTANVFSGAVRNTDTLNWLEKLFGKIRQVRSGLSLSRSQTSISVNEYMDHLIPASKIAALKAGELVGQVASESGSGQNTFHCKVDIDPKTIAAEERDYKDIAPYYNFKGSKEAVLEGNMQKIKSEVALTAAQFHST